MSLFGLNGFHDPSDVMSTYMRQMRHMNTMMSSMMCGDPFGMMGYGGMMSNMGMMGNMGMMNMGMMDMGMGMGMGMGSGSSSSSSTIVMAADGEVYSSTSSTKVGPNGVKETRRTVQDSRSGTKKMAIGHHIDDRAHVIEREQNLRSGDLEEHQEFINIDEEEAPDFDREFQRRSRAPRLLPALPAPPPATSPSSRRPVRHLALPASASSSSSVPHGVRHTYGAVQPQRSKQRGSKNHHNHSDY